MFNVPGPGQIAVMGVALLLVIGGLWLRTRSPLPVRDPATEEDSVYKAAKKKRRNATMLTVFGGWLFSGLFLGMFTREKEIFHVTISPPRYLIFGQSISSSVVISWAVIAVIAVIALLIRLFVIPRFKEEATGFQAVLETMVEALSDFTSEKFGGRRHEGLAAYFFGLAVMFIGTAFVELLGVRPPTTDLTMTLSYALVTFILIQSMGVRSKGAVGHLKGMAEPNAIVTPFKILSEIAIPISLACRLFGNMLGGMIVVDLVYMALGSFSVGIPAVLGLYFNAFHPLIQFFIFINLSLTFIGDAAEQHE